MRRELPRIAVSLRDQRRRARLSQRELAQLSDVSASVVARIEKGFDQKTGAPVVPKPDTLRRLANGLVMREDEPLDLPASDALYLDLMRAAGHEIPLPPRPDPEPSLTDDERKLLQAFRGRLRPLRDFMVQTDGFEEADRRLVLNAVEWALSHIEAVKAWEDARQATIGAQQGAQQIAREHSNAQV